MSINSVINNSITNESVVNAVKPVPPTITGYTISGLDDTALDPAGGQTILLNGTGFQQGATVTINGVAVSVVTFVNGNQLSFTSPAQSAGTYTIYAVNANGGTAIYVPGLIYSNLPTWTTAAGTLGSYYETQTIANTVVASGDAPVTYSLFSGALPTGAVFNANGTISGTAPADSGSTTYSFTVQATDAQKQDSTRSFSLTINTDVVSWVTPASGATIELSGIPYSSTLSATSAAGYNIASYTANTLPTGITISGNTMSGTPTVAGTTTTLLTATAATTGRSATRTISWVISIGDPNWKYTTLLLPGAGTVFNQDVSTNNFNLAVTGSVQASNFSPFATSSDTSNSAVFASGGYLSIPASSQFAIASGDDFCLEMWVYYTSTPSGYSFMFSMGDGTNSLSLRTGDSGFQYKIQAEFGPSSLSSLFDNGSYTRSNLVSKWTHLVLCRSGGTASFFYDGTRIATKSSNTTTLGTASGSINTASPYQFEGYASNVRFVKGSSVYNPAASSITVPTEPLTAITNTRLLALQNSQPANNNTFFDNSTNKFAITRAGNATQGSFTPYGANWSNYFDGTGDYLTTPTGQIPLTLGTSNFTIEMWAYPTTQVRGNPALFTSDPGVGLTNAILVQFVATTGQTILWVNNINLTASSTTNYIVLNQWNHIAVVRSGGSTYAMYINGVAVNNVATNSTSLTTNSWYVGYWTVADNAYTGYISNFRIVKSTAVYTSNFTPSTTPLTAITNTTLLTCQSNSFVDNSANNFAITKAGDVSVQRFSPFNPVSLTPASYSGYFDGSGDYLTVANNAALALGSGAFTVEIWLYISAYNASTSRIIDWRSNGDAPSNIPVIVLSASGAPVFYADVSTGALITGSSAIALNTWAHLAIVRSGSTVTMYLNGTSIGSASNSLNLGVETLNLNDPAAGSTYGQRGYFSNFRIVKGTAVYTSNFTPSTTPLTAISGTSLLTLQSTTFIDNSTNAFAITAAGDAKPSIQNPFGSTSTTTTGYTTSTTGGSAYFDNTGDYLTAPANSALALGTGNFTLEAWVYNVGGFATDPIFESRSSGATATGYAFLVTSTGYLNVYTNGAFVGQSSTTLTTGTWNHVALVRTGTSTNQTTYYINGIASGTITLAGNFTDASSVVTTIGGSTSVGENWGGYISDARIVKGTAVYTSNFVPPTAPLTAITNTQLLLNFTSAGIYDASTQNNLETVGDAKLSTAVTKFGSTSLYFDGTGDYLLTAGSQSTEFGAGDFTIELWWYPTSTARQALYHGSFGTDWSVGIDYSPVSTNQKIGIWASSNGTSWNLLNADPGGNAIGTTTLTQNAWNHIAYVRSGTSWMLFVNGNRDVNVTGLSGTIVSRPTAQRAIGCWWNTSALGLVNGYIDDFRITKGYARYTANFTPPTEAFQIK